jgi:2-phosphosulfolactate phosphatase
MKTLEVLFTPADFATLTRRNLNNALCVVFDVFRATSSMVTALANGAAAVIPVAEISDALAIRKQHPGVLLAGERDGVRIRAAISGGVEFDLGNSPREFTRERVAGKTIVTTTTNGTRALQACAHAKTVLLGSFLNLGATAQFIVQQQPATLLIVCSGTFDQAAYEDILGAGALCDALPETFQEVSDSTLVARRIFELAKANLLKAASESRNGRRLQAIAELKDDVPFCLQQNIFSFVAGLRPDGKVTAM